MQVHYERDMNSNYIVFSDEMESYSGYQEQMLKEKQIRGLLKTEVRYKNAKALYFYEITSRQPLDTLFERRKISGEEVWKLMQYLHQTVDELERHLLDGVHVLLDPKYIFAVPDTFSIEFCYYPASEKPFWDAMTELLRYLMDRLDYADQGGVILVYTLYHTCMKNNLSMEQVMEEVRKQLAENMPVFKKREQAGDILQDEDTEFLQEDIVSPTRPSFEGFWQRFLRKIRQRFSHRLIHVEEVVEEQEEPEVIAVSQAAPVSAAGETVLLNSVVPINRTWKFSADDGEHEIQINKTPFIIGKRVRECDYCIEYPQISRIHARIEESEEGCYLTDLNSTNGTCLNGERLPAHTKVKVNAGDKISFAHLTFRVSHVTLY